MAVKKQTKKQNLSVTHVCNNKSLFTVLIRWKKMHLHSDDGFHNANYFMNKCWGEQNIYINGIFHHIEWRSTAIYFYSNNYKYAVPYAVFIIKSFIYQFIQYSWWASLTAYTYLLVQNSLEQWNRLKYVISVSHSLGF